MNIPTTGEASILRNIAAASASVAGAKLPPPVQARSSVAALPIAIGAALAGGAGVLGIQALTGKNEATPLPPLNVVEAGARLVARYDTDGDGSVEYPQETREIIAALFTVQADSGKPPAAEARRPADGSRPFDYRITAWEYTETLRQFDENGDGLVSADESEDLIETIDLLLTPPAQPRPSAPPV